MSSNEQLQLCTVHACAKLSFIGGADVDVMHSLHDCINSCAGIE